MMTKSELKSFTSELKSFVRAAGGCPYPGGYQCALMMEDGEVIDHQSTRENYKQILMCARRGTSSRDCWMPSEVIVHWEGEPMVCAHSGRLIEPSYHD